MTDSLERFLQDLRFDVPVGLVDRAKAAAVEAPAREPRELGWTSRNVSTTQPVLRNRRADRDWPVGRRTELIAGIAAVVLALIVIGTFAYIRIVAGPRAMVPAAPDPTIKQYQAFIAAHQSAVSNNFLNDQCNVNPPESTACADEAALAIGRLQQWLDDLNQIQPPGRFAALDARLRIHLSLVMVDLRAVIGAGKGMDASGAATALAAALNERDWLQRETTAVMFSGQETVQSYSAIVRSGDASLLTCGLCQQLLSQNQLSCEISQIPSCADEIDASRLEVETLEDALVRGFAPNALAAKDARLQADLLAADLALNSMSSSLSAGNQAQLAAGRNALRQALSLVDRDATDIARGG